jgi:SAM-dependent methyltransferase
MISELLTYLKYQVNFPKLESENGIHLDLGSGKNVRNPCGLPKVYGIDISNADSNLGDSFQIISADITKELPFPDNYFDSISAFDVLEHIPRWERNPAGEIVFPFVNLMSEIYRILKPLGIFIAVTPAYPAAEAFQDPTHVNILTEQTVDYFIGENPSATTVGYGFKGNFTKLHHSWLKGGGPFESLENRLAPGYSEITQIRDSMKILKRGLKILRIRNSSHLLWVLRAEK